jgi:hypothetical protein
MITGRGDEFPGSAGTGALPGAAVFAGTSAFPQVSLFPYACDPPKTASAPAETGPAQPPALSETPIFARTAAMLGPPGFHETSPRTQGSQRTAESPATGEPPAPDAFPSVSEVYGATMPVEPVWAPSAADAPGVFADPAGRRRLRVRWVAVAAGLVLGGFLVVAAVGLLGGPKAPLLPWAQPDVRPGTGTALGTHRHAAPARRGAVNPTPAATPHVLAGPQATHPPGTSATPQATTSAPSQHTPPGLAHRPSPQPAKSHPAVP